MSKIQLTELLEEILEELRNENTDSTAEINEISPKLLGRAIRRAQQKSFGDKGAAKLAHDAGVEARKKGDIPAAQRAAKLAVKNTKSAAKRDSQEDKFRSALVQKTFPQDTVKVKNPETGQEILAITAYKAGPQHPAYAAAKSALKKEIVQHMNESTVGKHTMIRLKNLLVENPENRINLMKVQTVMEKLYPELKNDQSKKLMELCTEVHMMAAQLNTKPYLRTESSIVEWKIMVAAMHAKLNELKEEVVSICEKAKIDCTVVVKALDEVILN